MNITKTLYPQIEKVKQFEETWGKIRDWFYWESLLEIHHIYKNDRFMEEEQLKSFCSRYRYNKITKLLNFNIKAINKPTPEHKEKEKERKKLKEDLSQVVQIVEQYGETTMKYIDEKGFNLTIAEIAVNLDIQESYITRNIIPTQELDYFDMNNYARYAIKVDHEGKYDPDFINKKQFISYESYVEFIKRHIKYTNYNKRIILNFTDEQRRNLDGKFTDKEYKTALKCALAAVERKYETEIVESILNNTFKKVLKKDLELCNLTEELLNCVLNSEAYKIKSRATFKAQFKQEAYEEMIARYGENKDYKVKSFNDRQVDIRLNQSDNARLVFTGLMKKVKVNGKNVIQNKEFVRYMANSAMLAEDSNADACSIPNVTYKQIEKHIQCDETVDNIVTQHVYNYLEGYKVKSKKGNK